MKKQGVKKVCAFCGDPSNKLSGEHVFPDWLNKYLRSSKKIRNVQKDKEREKTWHSEDINRTVKHVCIDCNEGWMSSLEAETEPILGGIAFNHQPKISTLDRAQQGTLAFWAQKTALVMELTAPRSHSISRTQYKNMYKTKKPLSSVFVGIAFRLSPTRSEEHPALSYNKYDHPVIEESNKDLSWCVCIAVGKVVFLVIGNNSDYDGGVGISDERILRVINPYTRPVKWFPEWPVEAIGGYDQLKSLVELRLDLISDSREQIR